MTRIGGLTLCSARCAWCPTTISYTSRTSSRKRSGSPRNCLQVTFYSQGRSNLLNNHWLELLHYVTDLNGPFPNYNFSLDGKIRTEMEKLFPEINCSFNILIFLMTMKYWSCTTSIKMTSKCLDTVSNSEIWTSIRPKTDHVSAPSSM